MYCIGEWEVFADESGMSRIAGQKIKRLREHVLRESQEAFADRLGVEQPTVSRWEAGKPVSRKHQKTIADLAGASVGEFFHSNDMPVSIPIVGYVSAGDSFAIVEDHEPGGGLDYFTPKIDSTEVVAVVVRGDSMLPVYRNGDTIIGKRTGRRDLMRAIGRDCIVKTTSGEGYVKRVLAGTDRHTVRLRSYNQLYDDIEDVQIEWAAPIIWISRG
jgi:phage repressor protein C with HTH and peptisase S24 domain